MMSHNLMLCLQDELTPLMIAAQKGKNAIVNVLLKGKADPNIQAMVLT